MDDVHHETLEEAVTHTTDEARMVLPGVQAILGFQLIAVFNQKFDALPEALQLLHLAAFLLLALAMGLLMAPAACHRQAERGRVSRRLLELSSTLLTLALLPLLIGVSLDTYILTWLIARSHGAALVTGVAVFVVLGTLWYGLPRLMKHPRS
jgi:hypothetical protein